MDLIWIMCHDPVNYFFNVKIIYIKKHEHLDCIRRYSPPYCETPKLVRCNQLPLELTELVEWSSPVCNGT